MTHYFIIQQGKERSIISERHLDTNETTFLIVNNDHLDYLNEMGVLFNGLR